MVSRRNTYFLCINHDFRQKIKAYKLTNLVAEINSINSFYWCQRSGVGIFWGNHNSNRRPQPHFMGRRNQVLYKNRWKNMFLWEVRRKSIRYLFSSGKGIEVGEKAIHQLKYSNHHLLTPTKSNELKMSYYFIIL